MEKYSTIEAFVEGVESGNISRNFFDSKAVAIAYVLLGRKDDALHYLDQCIEEQKKLDIYGKGVEVVETKGLEKWYIFLKKIGISKGSYYFLRN